MTLKFESNNGETIISVWAGDGEVRVEKDGVDVFEIVKKLTISSGNYKAPDFQPATAAQSRGLAGVNDSNGPPNSTTAEWINVVERLPL